MNTLPNIISLGAGVQSSTMALMAAHGEITPMPVAAIFADTQAEPTSVYRWLDWLEKQLPFPVYRVSQGSLTDACLKTRTNRKTGRPYYSNMIPGIYSGCKRHTRKSASPLHVRLQNCSDSTVRSEARGNRTCSTKDWRDSMDRHFTG